MIVAIIQRAGRHQSVVSADNSCSIVCVPPGNVSLQVLRFRRCVDAPISMRMRVMMVMVMMMMQMMTVAVIGRPRNRFVSVGHRVRHEGHHFTREIRRTMSRQSLYSIT